MLSCCLAMGACGLCASASLAVCLDVLPKLSLAVSTEEANELRLAIGAAFAC